MRVRYDEQIFLSQRRGGISSYFANLVGAFLDEPSIGVEPVGFPMLSPNAYLQDLGLGRPIRSRLVPQRRKVYIALNAITRSVRRRPPAEVEHPTFYFSAPPRGARLVVTIHDMTPELFPGLISGRNPHFRKMEHVRAASAIACVSRTTAQDLLRIHPEVQAPIVITPLAVGPAFHPRIAQAGGRPFLLFVGTRAHDYKHFDVFVQAAAEVVAQSDVDLVLVGGGALTDQDREVLRASGMEARTRHVTPTDEELGALYAAAAAFVFPSAYEGFGLPVLEAMASGCPVVASDAPALVEVAGGAAVHAPVGDVTATAAAIRRVLDDEAFADALRSRGLARTERASWADTARATRDCYRTALE